LLLLDPESNTQKFSRLLAATRPSSLLEQALATNSTLSNASGGGSGSGSSSPSLSVFAAPSPPLGSTQETPQPLLALSLLRRLGAALLEQEPERLVSYASKLTSYIGR
jgi:hypothetical protein